MHLFLNPAEWRSVRAPFLRASTAPPNLPGRDAEWRSVRAPFLRASTAPPNLPGRDAEWRSVRAPQATRVNRAAYLSERRGWRRTGA